MGLQEATKIIDTAKSRNSDILDLFSLKLSTEDLKTLIPLIAETNVTKLYLSDNSFEVIPESIGSLTRLTVLNIDEGDFSDLPESIADLTNLRKLYIRGNNFTTLSQTIGKLQNLRELVISGDRFAVLPESIGDLTNLSKLFVIGNNFTTLPQSIGKLQNLRDLIISAGRFAVLPESIGDLTNLRQLNLQNSAIRVVPETLRYLQNLEKILLVNCPLSDETMIWLDHTFPLEVVTYNMAAYSKDQSAEEILQLLYTDPKEQKSIIERIENCDLDPTIIIYGGSDTQVKSAEDIINEFLSKVQIHSQYDWDFYGPPIKSTLDSILDKEHFSKAERANNLAIMTTRMGDCPTPIREGLAQEAVKQLLIQKGKLSEINQARIEREALRDTINKLKGYRPNEKIEQSYGLINSIYLNHAEENPKNPNLRIMGERTRLPSITPYPDFGFQQIQNNPALIHEFVGMVCQTTANNQPVLDNGAYCLDINKIKKIKDQYITQFGFETEQQNEIKKHLQMYSNEMTGFIKEKKELVNNYFQEAEHLLDIIAHKEKLQKLLTTGDIKQEYDQFLTQKKTEILTFLEEKKNPKPQLDKFTVPINEKAPNRSKSPNRSDKKQTDNAYLTPRR